jgi:hypothetical protein
MMLLKFIDAPSFICRKRKRVLTFCYYYQECWKFDKRRVVLLVQLVQLLVLCGTWRCVVHRFCCAVQVTVTVKTVWKTGQGQIRVLTVLRWSDILVATSAWECICSYTRHELALSSSRLWLLYRWFYWPAACMGSLLTPTSQDNNVRIASVLRSSC